ncbi:MAG: ABC transporter ATP-binding protein [Lewinellaceae bacterium]|nr:ABC transporter ATP-binding protein [Lewinella sp.]MCB9279601.1 ABC transporter ATP-binding protein [Lewinellaceae bacterium]
MKKRFSILNNPYISLMRTAWVYARDQRKKYLTVYGLFTLSNLSNLLDPVIWGLFINQLQLQGVDALRSVWLYAVAHLVVHLFGWACHGPARILERQLAFDLSRNFLQELYHKTLHLPVSWHQDHHSGATINRVRKAYEALKSFFDTGFMYFNTIAKMVFALGAMVWFSPVFGSIAILMGVFIVYIILRFDKPFIEASKETNEREHEVSATLFDSLSNILTVITLRLEKRMESGLLGRVMAILPPFRRKILVNEWKWFTVDTMVTLMYVMIVIGYIFQHWVPGEVLLVGGLVTLVGYVNQFTSVFHNIAWQYTSIVTYDTDIKTAQNIIKSYDERHLPEAGDGLHKDWKTIQLQNLGFMYKEAAPESDKIQGLHGLKLRIQRGKRLALIGESGSGKSTLLALLRGLYSPDRAEVALDGKPIAFQQISDHVTLFPQEPEIFENTIAYNITLGLPFEEQEILRVCEIAQFREVINQLPKGLESGIQEKGVNLSGGQKQRLALARGILAARDSDIVLLDEPTSSVDPKTELLIYDRLFEEFSDKAVVSSLHRLHLLPRFDYIYILENGRVVGEGNFQTLLADSPAFQELWRHQDEFHTA